MQHRYDHNLILFTGVISGILFWVFDSIIDTYLFNLDETFLQTLLYPEVHELWMRIVVLILLVGVSLFASHLLRKMEHLNIELENHRHNLEEIVSIRTEQLEKLASIDDLTQLYNRRKFNSLLEQELARNMRYGRDLSIIMFDIDHFKNINDSFGHATGDATLSTLARLCSDAIRNTDILGRIGGEEFMLLLPETPKQNARILAERLRDMIANHPFPGVEHITISMGVTAVYENDTIDSLFSRVDIALYAAKENGRNRVVVA